jgi:DNA adenine methylase
MTAESFIKWVGAKNRVKDLITSLFPEEYNDYYEPFLGGGSIFLHNLKGNRRFYLSDINQDLINLWKTIQSNVEPLIELCEKHKSEYNNNPQQLKKFHELREQFNSRQSNEVESSALFYILLKAGFNGLVRYNKKGILNSGWGERNIRFEANDVREINKLLREHEVYFSAISFEEIQPKQGDLVFCDPPYIPVGNRILNRRAYSKKGFDKKLFNILSQVSEKWSNNSVKMLICNHDSEGFRKLFPNYNYYTYSLLKTFAANMASRIDTLEVVARNFL